MVGAISNILMERRYPHLTIADPNANEPIRIRIWLTRVMPEDVSTPGIALFVADCGCVSAAADYDDPETVKALTEIHDTVMTRITAVDMLSDVLEKVKEEMKPSRPVRPGRRRGGLPPRRR